MAKRSGKFYRNNEKEVMNSLGLEETPNSGSGWIIKEDGQNEHLICQLKSTDSNSIRISLLDIEKLFHNASVEHKIPIFAIQFLKSGDVFILSRPCDIESISKYLKLGINDNIFDDVLSCESVEVRKGSVVKSSKSGRERFNEEMQKRYGRKEKKAK